MDFRHGTFCHSNELGEILKFEIAHGVGLPGRNFSWTSRKKFGACIQAHTRGAEGVIGIPVREVGLPSGENDTKCASLVGHLVTGLARGQWIKG